MNVTGIIAEYNPFHNGHCHQLELVKQHCPDTYIIVVMSGSFCQRGEAALLSKWERADLAVQNGCDLVLELPAVCAVRSAQDFARGGVRLLSRLGIVNTLAFGSELADAKALADLARAVNREDVKQLLHQGLAEGHSYASALCHALASATGLSEESLRQPNTILAIEYLRALNEFPSATPIRPLPLQRTQVRHDDSRLTPGITSAASIRLALADGAPDWKTIQTAVPPAVFHSLRNAKENGLPDMEHLFRPLLCKLFRMDSDAFRSIYTVSEGLEHRLLKCMRQSENLAGLVRSSASARYPQSRIRRLLFYLLTEFTKIQAKEFDISGPLYARVLALNDRGRILLRRIRQTSSLPVISKPGAHLDSRQLLLPPSGLSLCRQQLKMDMLSTNLRGLTLPTPQTNFPDLLTSPVYRR